MAGLEDESRARKDSGRDDTWRKRGGIHHQLAVEVAQHLELVCEVLAQSLPELARGLLLRDKPELDYPGRIGHLDTRMAITLAFRGSEPWRERRDKLISHDRRFRGKNDDVQRARVLAKLEFRGLDVAQLTTQERNDAVREFLLKGLLLFDTKLSRANNAFDSLCGAVAEEVDLLPDTVRKIATGLQPRLKDPKHLDRIYRARYAYVAELYQYASRLQRTHARLGIHPTGPAAAAVRLLRSLRNPAIRELLSPDRLGPVGLISNHIV